LSSLAWFFTHLDDVRSDMSVFHRVDDIESIPVARLVPLMVRLPVYDGAVQFAIRNEPERGVETRIEPTEPIQPATTDQLQAMNSNPLYGPMQGQMVGMFDVVTVPAA
jgi:hypothetical protein